VGQCKVNADKHLNLNLKMPKLTSVKRVV